MIISGKPLLILNTFAMIGTITTAYHREEHFILDVVFIFFFVLFAQTTYRLGSETGGKSVFEYFIKVAFGGKKKATCREMGERIATELYSTINDKEEPEE